MNLSTLLLKTFKDNIKRFSMFMLTCLLAMIGFFISFSLNYASKRIGLNANLSSLLYTCNFLIAVHL